MGNVGNLEKDGRCSESGSEEAEAKLNKGQNGELGTSSEYRSHSNSQNSSEILTNSSGVEEIPPQTHSQSISQTASPVYPSYPSQGFKDKIQQQPNAGNTEFNTSSPPSLQHAKKKNSWVEETVTSDESSSRNSVGEKQKEYGGFSEQEFNRNAPETVLKKDIGNDGGKVVGFESRR
jgi:hypothetical protein